MIRVVVVLPLTPVTAIKGIRPLSSGSKERVDNCLANRLSRTFCRIQVDGEVWRGMDGGDNAVLRTHRPTYVSSQDINARHVEPHNPRSVNGEGRDFRMDLIQHVRVLRFEPRCRNDLAVDDQ